MTIKTNNNFDFLVEYISAKITEWIIRDQHIGVEEALMQFYESETFDRLCDRATEMYVESPIYIYEVFQEEAQKGTLRGITE